MKRTRFDKSLCSVARVVDLMGDWWTPLVLRECFYGIKKFGDFQTRLGIGKNILTQRLERLVKDGLLVKVPYQERPVRYDYKLTPMGRELFSVVCALMRWGDDWLAEPSGPPVILVDRRTGKPVKPLVVDEYTGEKLEARHVYATPGPGTPEGLREDAVRYLRGEPSQVGPEL